MKHSAFRLICFILLLTQLSVFDSAQTKPDATSQPLEPGKPIERELKGGEIHIFSFVAEANQLLNLLVDQRGIDVVVELIAPDGKQLREVDSPNGTQGPEQITIITEMGGVYELKVRSLENEAPAGRYEAQIQAQRTATERDRNRLSARRIYAEAFAFEQQRDAVSLRKAISKYEESIPFWQAGKEPDGEAIALNNIGLLYHELGESEKAITYYERSIVLDRASGRLAGEAIALGNIGAAYDNLSEPQKALDYYFQALGIISGHNAYAEASTLNNIGKIYAALGEYQKATDYLVRSLSLLREIEGRENEARTLTNLGASYSGLGEKQKALETYNKALALNRAANDPRGGAVTLYNIGKVHDSLGDRQKALDFFNQSLELRRKVGDRIGEAATLNGLSNVYYFLGDQTKAEDLAGQALTLSQTIGDKSGQATALYRLASIERARGDLTKSRAHIESALAILESLRTKLAGRESRLSFFATVQNYYEFYTDTLMQQHKKSPSAGYDALALQTSELARARSLLESLSEARTDLRQGVDPQLLERERSLQQKLNARAERQTRILSRKESTEEIAALQKEIATLTTDFQDVQTQIRRNSPRYAALTQPVPLTTIEIQRDLLDSDTVLLEYALGEERSYLWVVSKTSLKSYELPKREKIETAARRVYELLGDGKRWAQGGDINAQYVEAAGQLSDMLLSPVAGELKGKRLVIVADGVLQYIPFSALSIRSKSEFEPLAVGYEIVSLPSASTLAVLRRETANRKQAPKSIIVFADPIFTDTDERLATVKINQPTTKEKPKTNINSSRALMERVFNLRSESNDALPIARLPFTRREAEAILSFAPAETSRKALDFTAKRELVLSRELSEYRIVHFATHGLLNSEHPELSGIVLSLFNEQGEPIDGFLRLNEIYNLNLSADLVVLSACQTALGKEIKGEGLIGLTRGFMYAGSPRVVASLWKVDDVATAELMKVFYQKMLRERMNPAAALRAAKVEMWKQKRWSAPFYWAAFELQGEWR
jgi:CHAT domain-containing protein/Tfp pilus assembly protein PilF